MNLFILSVSPKETAESMFDCHIVKIILEAVQMLCTAKLLLDPEDPTNEKLYKLCHKNHPVSIWVRKSFANYMWTLKLVHEMHNEWQFRYNHSRDTCHKSYLVAYHLLTHPPPKEKFECKGLTLFAQAMPDEYRVPNDPVQAYKLYYMSDKKKRLAKWTKRNPPSWYIM